MNNKIGLQIKKIRKKHKDTLISLAEKINYDYSNLSKVERGQYTASPDLLENIAKVYNIDVSYFFYEDKDLQKFTDNEKELIMERTLTPELLKEKFDLEIDGKPATDEEIEKMIEYVKALRHINQNGTK